MIICQCKVHHRSDNNLTVYHDWLVLDCMKTEDSSLWKVDDWRTHEGAEYTTVADGESSSSHVLDCELVVTSLQDRLASA